MGSRRRRRLDSATPPKWGAGGDEPSRAARVLPPLRAKRVPSAAGTTRRARDAAPNGARLTRERDFLPVALAFYLLDIGDRISSLMSHKKRSYNGFFTTRVKFYPSSADSPRLKPASIVVFDRPVFNPFGYEDDYQMRSSAASRSDSMEESERAEKNKSRALSRARHNICDLVSCNFDLDLFVTLTFDKTVVDRYSYSDIMKNLKIWLSNRSQRQGLKYVLIPEIHKGKKYKERPEDYIEGAIHFHGFFNSSAVRLVDSGHKTKEGKSIYNIDDFPYGFTTGIIIPSTAVDRTRVSRYILKYVTKDSEKVGGRYYLHGGRLALPTYAYSNDLITDELCAAEPYTFAPYDGATCKLYDCAELTDLEGSELFHRYFSLVSTERTKDDFTV